MEAKRAAQPASGQPCSASDTRGDTPGSASNGPSEVLSRSGSAAPTCASPAKGLRKRLWAGASPELGKKRACRATAYEEMSHKDLLSLADRTPGMRSRKKVGDKWKDKQREELVAEFKAFDAKKGAQPLAGPRWEEMSLKALQDLADKTPGMTKKKKVGKKFVTMNRDEEIIRTQWSLGFNEMIL